MGAAPPSASVTKLVVLRLPIAGYGRLWPAITLRQPSPGALEGADDHVAVARHSGVPLGAIYDLSPDDLAEALAWLRGAAS